MSSLQITVVIPVFNDDRLKACLDALDEQTLGVDRFEVIVVDNGSDHPQESLVAEYAFARFVEESTPGSYAARNTALKIARGEILAFTDSDCVPAPDWLETAVARIEAAEGPLVVGGRVDLFPQDPARPSTAELVDIAFGFNQERTIGESAYVVTANLIAPRSLFDKIGPFDQRLLSGADGEWSQRAGASGAAVVYASECSVAHPARATFAEMLRKQRRTVGGRLVRNAARTPATLSFWVTAFKRVLPDVGRVSAGRKRLRDQGYTGTAWMRMAAGVLFMQYAALVEYVRLKLGGKPERR